MGHEAPTSLEGRTTGLAPSELDWPRWIPVGAAIAATALGTNITYHRGAFSPTLWGIPMIVVVATTVLPWLLDAGSACFIPSKYIPEWLFSLVVLSGTAAILSQPVDVDPAPFFLVFLTAEMASRLTWRRSAAVAAGAAAVMIGVDVFGAYDDSFIWIIGIGFAYFGGFAIQSQMRLATEHKLAQAGLAERAAADERARIAREVHDVIAHSMSVTMLHLTAARMALERGRSTDALEALREAEHQGRRSLTDIRRTVGVLGQTEIGSDPPMPTAADLSKLVDDFRSAGLDVALSVDGDVLELPAGVGLNLYRIVQESLTNVAKHAPGAGACVELDVADDVRLIITNSTGNGSPELQTGSGGLGLRGMSERAAMLGGELHAGPDGKGGWAVRLVAPRPTE